MLPTRPDVTGLHPRDSVASVTFRPQLLKNFRIGLDECPLEFLAFLMHLQQCAQHGVEILGRGSHMAVLWFGFS